MAKNNKKLDNFTENEYSGARLLQKILEKSEYTDQRQVIKDTFDRVAPSPAIEIINEIAEMTEIPKEDRQQALMSIYNAMVEAMEKVDKIELPDVKWKDRGKENRFMSPCEFVLEHYPDTNLLSLPMISHHDPALFKALVHRKERQGWDEGFFIANQSEYNDKKLEEVGGVPMLPDIAMQSPPHIKELLRLHQLGRTRKTKGQLKRVNKP